VPRCGEAGLAETSINEIAPVLDIAQAPADGRIRRSEGVEALLHPGVFAPRSGCPTGARSARRAALSRSWSWGREKPPSSSKRSPPERHRASSFDWPTGTTSVLRAPSLHARRGQQFGTTDPAPGGVGKGARSKPAGRCTGRPPSRWRRVMWRRGRYRVSLFVLLCTHNKATVACDIPFGCARLIPKLFAMLKRRSVSQCHRR